MNVLSKKTKYFNVYNKIGKDLNAMCSSKKEIFISYLNDLLLEPKIEISIINFFCALICFK